MRQLFSRPGLGLVLTLAAAWIVLVIVLHLTLNRRPPVVPGAEARTVQVGGLPVT